MPEGSAPSSRRATFRRSDGLLVRWESRRHRKQHSLLDTGRGSTWWAPGAIGWWIGVLFAIGSICFALGAAPGYVEAVGDAADAVTYFVGSIFFTSAALLQYLEVANAPRELPESGRTERWRLFTWEPRRIDWIASVVQLAGTFFFNASTFHAMSENLSASQANRLVWAPGRARLDRVPRRQRPRVGRGEPRLVVLAPPQHLLVDHRPQPRRLDRVRRVSSRIQGHRRAPTKSATSRS